MLWQPYWLYTTLENSKILVANHVSRILYLAIFIREHNICLFRKELVGNGTTTLILSLPLASCLFSQKCVFPVEVLLKAACTEFKYRGEIWTEVLICILKGNNTDYQWVPVLSYCKEEVHLDGFWSLRKASSLHLHTNICISGLCTDIWTSVTIEIFSPTGIQQWVRLFGSISLSCLMPGDGACVLRTTGIT